MPPSVSPSQFCDQCKATGLPILPVRYAVMPKSIKPGLPDWAGGDRVKNVSLGEDFHYVLRTLRTGYLYLFYDKNARGSKQWECYAIGDDGSLTRQLTPQSAQPQSTPVLQCSRHGANNTQVHYLVIEHPEKCGATWIAYSEHKWSDETIAAYETNSKLRNKRMQTIQPPAMAAGAKHSHGQIAAKAALESVLEYAQARSLEPLPFNPPVSTLSNEDGTCIRDGQFEQMSTRYPWYLRTGMAESTVKHMENRGKGEDKPSKPHVLALWDAVGITHELNGFRNDAAGWLTKYRDERELQISAFNAIDGTKRAMEQGAADRVRDFNAVSQSSPTNEMMRLRAPIVKATRDEASAQAFSQQYYALSQSYRNGDISLEELQARRAPLVQRYAKDPAELQAALAREDDIKRASKRGDQQEQARAAAQAWPKYKEHIDGDALERFKKNWDGLLTQANKVIDQRTEALISWLEAQLFIDTLEDFHRTSEVDGVLFEDCVGEAIFGMGSSAAGKKKIDVWIKEAKASIDTNLLWRAIALNQQEGLADIDEALNVIYGGPKPLSGQTWAGVAGHIKWNKFADLGKKSLTAFNTQMKAIDPKSGIRPVQRMRGLDKIFLSVGGSWLKPLTGAVDTVNELALRTLLLARSGVSAEAAKAVAVQDAMHYAADRQMLVRRLMNQDYYLSQAAQADYEARAAKWKALRTNVEVPDASRGGSFNAARDARMALIVAVFEAFNLYKAREQAAKSPKSEKAQATLAAAKLATVAAALDVTSNWVKALAGAGDRAVGYQMLKLAGGALSATASGYGAMLDFHETGASESSADYRMMILFGIRGTFQATSAVLSSLTALSYCSPLIETFGKRFGERLIAKALTTAATRLLLARAALVFASLEVSVFVLAVTFIIWYFEDDALQKWCDRCAFGLKRAQLQDSYKTAESQLAAFNKALTGAE
ncbi:T6SS effector BTH_I2691 family protein (plasmid) [Ralstonia sp. 25C]|uniref:T6SS effector BTH_I2691 family protein n=1 Tax=Ralstonia sp. 25C TaxID=3447363 RepID=UPI003F74C686